MTSGFSEAMSSLVIALNGLASVAAPTSCAPIAVINESAPDPLPPIK